MYHVMYKHRLLPERYAIIQKLVDQHIKANYASVDLQLVHETVDLL